MNGKRRQLFARILTAIIALIFLASIGIGIFLK